MIKSFGKKTIFALWLFGIAASITITTAYADFNDRIENFFDPKPLPIDIRNNPSSISGTYDIERLVINDKETPILDSDNDYAVEDDRGEMSIKVDTASGAIHMAFKMQMSGPAFAKGSNLAPYSFIYESKTINIPQNGSNMEENFGSIGIHVYDHDKIVWEIPFEGTKTIILILEKESDRVKNIQNSKYLFL